MSPLEALVAVAVEPVETAVVVVAEVGVADTEVILCVEAEVETAGLKGAAAAAVPAGVVAFGVFCRTLGVDWRIPTGPV